MSSSRSSYRGSPQRSRSRQVSGQSRFSAFKLRLIIGGVIVLFALANHAMKGQVNPITGENQKVSLTVKEEIMMGMQSAPQMGTTSLNRQATLRVKNVGQQLVQVLDQYLAEQGKSRPYPFEFHLLADAGRNRGSINAFALPGGQVFVTESLYRRLDPNNDGELAGVLGHEIGHVLERHSAERIAGTGLLQSIAGAIGVAAGSHESSRAAQAVGNLIVMKYGREDELESDHWGVRLMTLAGYNPEHLLNVMNVLEQAGGGGGQPEFLSTHPLPEHRREYIQEIIRQNFPGGIPAGLR